LSYSMNRSSGCTVLVAGAERRPVWRPCVTVVFAALVPLSACVHYQPKPLNPATSLTAIESRSVDDPQLRAFLNTNKAATTEPARWDLRALTLLAFYFHPDLDEARAAAAVSRGALITAGERPNPQLQPALGVNTTTPASTVPPWIPSLGLQLPWETAGKRGYRIAEARHRVQAAQLRIVNVAWQVRVRVRRTLLDFVASRRVEEILGRQTTLQSQIVQLLERQLEAGAVTPFEVTQARLAAANAALAADQAAFQRALSGTALADALGLPTASFERFASLVEDGEVKATQIPEAAEANQALLTRSDVLAALSDYEASQSSLQLEIARQYPDLQLGPGYQLDQTDHKWTVALGITLPVLNQNRGPIAEAQARREQAAGRLVGVQASALREISEARATLAAARQKLLTAESLLTTARQQEQRTRGRYDLGDVSRQEVLTSQLEVIAAEVARSDAQAQADRAAGALEDAMQSPLGFENVVLIDPRSPPKGDTLRQ
jgi:cobalt-zinc-cadmium efflux system outer membrane protein